MKTKIYLTSLLLFAVVAISNAQEKGSYYFSKTISATMEEATEMTKAAFKENGFGSITEIDMDKKLLEKIPDAQIKPYRILGMCNPGFAYKAIQIEENIGLFLPCKVVLKDIGNGKIEVIAVNPSFLMQSLGNEKLDGIADEVTKSFKKAINSL